MAALAERRIIPLEEHKARAEQQKADAAAEKARADAEAAEATPAEMEAAEEQALEAHAAEVAEAAADGEQDDAASNARPEHLRLLEALLFAASAPLDEKTLKARLPEGIDIKQALRELQTEYAPRGVNLMHIGTKWTFRTSSDLSWLLTKESVVPKKLSRAAIETLSVIAYHQPVTRAEVEEIRGVVMSKGTFDVLMETGWIRPRGRRKAPGRPITYGTSEDFLSHFGLESLEGLPGLDELKGSGLLDGRLPPGFMVPMPSDDPGLRDDEDPLEPGDLDLGLAPPPERVEE